MSVYLFVLLVGWVGYAFGYWAGKNRPIKYPVLFLMALLFVLVILASIAKFLYE